MDGRNAGRTRRVEDAPTDPRHVWTAGLPDARVTGTRRSTAGGCTSRPTRCPIGRDGSDGWTYRLGDERVAVPTMIEDEVVVCADGELIGLDATDGAVTWTVESDGTRAVVATREGLFLTGPGGHVLAYGDD